MLVPLVVAFVGLASALVKHETQDRQLMRVLLHFMTGLMGCNYRSCHFKALGCRRKMIRADQCLDEYHGDNCL